MKKFLFLAGLAIASTAGAQTGSSTFAARLREVLPAAKADSIIARVEAARARQLPAEALEQQALMLAAKGTPASKIEKAIDARAAGMAKAKTALASAGRRDASDDEVAAAGDLVRRGVDGKKVSELAKSAPSGRSLAVPLYVIGSLMDRGLPSDSALARVYARLSARATDSALTREARGIGDSISAARHARNEARKAARDSVKAERRDARDAEKGKPAVTGRDLAASKRPAHAGGGRPATVPAGTGKGNRPAIPGNQGKSPGKGRKG